MSSWPVTFYPRPRIWIALYLSKHLYSEITGLFDGVFIKLFRSLNQNGRSPHKTKYVHYIRRSWSWPFLTLLRRSGERFRTVRSSSLKLTFSKNSIWNTIRVVNGLDPDHDQFSASSYLGPNYLQRLSAEDKSCRQQGRVEKSIFAVVHYMYSKPSLKQPLKKKTKNWFSRPIIT